MDFNRLKQVIVNVLDNSIKFLKDDGKITLKYYINKEDNFVIKEDGKNISGGEKQRIGLVRMLIRKPEVLILDEITSGLDQEN